MKICRNYMHYIACCRLSNRLWHTDCLGLCLSITAFSDIWWENGIEFPPTIVSVRLWNFKDGGTLKARFWAKNQHTQGIFFFLDSLMNFGSSKSAKILLSKSIFYVKNQQIFFSHFFFFIQEYQFRRPFFVKNIFLLTSILNHFIY